MKGWWVVLRHAFKDYGADRCSEHAAALSYYTIFAIPPVLMLVLLAVGIFVGPTAIQSFLQTQAATVTGPQQAAAIGTMLQHAQRPDMGRPLTAAIGIGALVLSAIGFFLSLQSALDRAWDVAPDPRQSGVTFFLLRRAIAFGLMLAVGFLLLVSLVLSAAIAGLSGLIAAYIAGAFTGPILQAIDFGVSLVVVTVLFALIFKILPDAHIGWRDCWLGAFVTALLFVVGKLLIGLYLGHSHPGSAFGAAGSVILVLVWIYYSSMILLFGAELTQAYAVERGGGMRPKKRAVRIVEARAPNELANQPDSADAPEHAVGDEDRDRPRRASGGDD